MFVYQTNCFMSPIAILIILVLIQFPSLFYFAKYASNSSQKKNIFLWICSFLVKKKWKSEQKNNFIKVVTQSVENNKRRKGNY